MDSPWDDDDGFIAEAEWSKLSNEFTNVALRCLQFCVIHSCFQTGYREGITAGKESALQEGFDDGFARDGAPSGHDLGVLRGVASALLSFLSSRTSSHELEHESATAEMHDIVSKLANIRFTDIGPPDLEAEEHAREHLMTGDGELEVNEDVAEKREVEELEDMLGQIISGEENQSGRPTIEDLRLQQARLDALAQSLGLSISLS